MSYEITAISQLPSIEEVRKTSQALALADAIFMRNWEYRFFSFNCLWDKSGIEAMASMRDGSGSEYFLHFVNDGVAGKVLGEERLTEPYHFLDRVSNAFANFKKEPAFKIMEASFYFWRQKSDDEWSASPDDLENYPLLGFLTGGHNFYRDWAQDYYEREIDASVFTDVFSSLSVSGKQLQILNPDLTIDVLESDLQAIFGKE
jgi:hypothetical protein